MLSRISKKHKSHKECCTEQICRGVGTDTGAAARDTQEELCSFGIAQVKAAFHPVLEQFQFSTGFIVPPLLSPQGLSLQELYLSEGCKI